MAVKTKKKITKKTVVSVKKTAKKTVAAKKVVKAKPAKKAIKKVVKKVAKPATKKTVKPVKKAVKKTVKKVAKKAVNKKGVKKAVKKPVKKAAAKVTKVKEKASPSKTVKQAKKITEKQAEKKIDTVTKSAPKVEMKVTKEKTVKQPVKKDPMTNFAQETTVEINPMNVETPKKSTTLLGALEFMPYQPHADEGYMSEKQRQHFRDILNAWKLQLMQDVDLTVGHLKEEAVFYADPVDRAAQEEGFSLELRTRDRERKLIKKIEQALDLINSGDYGYCEDCGTEIGIRRLEARPTAMKCIDCKTIQEIREKQLGG